MPGTAQVGAPPKFPKSRVSEIYNGQRNQKLISFRVPKNTRMDTLKTRKPLFHNLKHQETELLK